MTRILSHYLCVASGDVRERTVVEYDNDHVITHIFSMDQDQCEPANTLFIDGIISGELIDPTLIIDTQAPIFEYIGKHAHPIVLGKQNKLIVWQQLDYTNQKLGTNARITHI